MPAEPKLNQFGFSLASLVIAMALLALIAALTASVIISTKKTELRSDLQIMLEKEQSYLLNRSRSISFLREQLGLVKRDPSGNLVANPAAAALRACFAGLRLPDQNCSEFNDTADTATTLKFRNGQVIQPGDEPTCSGPRCQIVSTIQIRKNCTTYRCQDIEVVARTEFEGSDAILQLQGTSTGKGGRESRGKIPGLIFGERQTINFECESDGFLTGISYQTMSTTCRGLSGNRECVDKRPLNSIGQGLNPSDPSYCKNLQIDTCDGTRYGYKRLDLLGGEECVRH